jgi:hypothetical protein
MGVFIMWLADSSPDIERGFKQPLFFFPILAMIVKNIYSIVPYNYYLVYLRQRKYQIRYDKSYSCAFALREEELLFR